ncbi:MAG TPA: TlpA disulfide reductase family protein [Gammaproteobacteria bacterium]|jgi:thiol-disulfide isomerase/thioredoxin|nr:TlpA disulfide reductase family protein [Gammaproteobacteria bacterium]
MRRFVLMLLAALPLALAWLPASAATPLDLAPYKGKVVYLDFWASWCKPCRQSFPWMNAMQKKYAGELVIVAVNLDEEQADAARFLKETPADFTVVYDPEGKSAEQYGIIGMPSSFVIGRDGQVLKKHQGFFEDSPAKYEAELREILGKQ